MKLVLLHWWKFIHPWHSSSIHRLSGPPASSLALSPFLHRLWECECDNLKCTIRPSTYIHPYQRQVTFIIREYSLMNNHSQHRHIPLIHLHSSSTPRLLGLPSPVSGSTLLFLFFFRCFECECVNSICVNGSLTYIHPDQGLNNTFHHKHLYITWTCIIHLFLFSFGCLKCECVNSIHKAFNRFFFLCYYVFII